MQDSQYFQVRNTYNNEVIDYLAFNGETKAVRSRNLIHLDTFNIDKSSEPDAQRG